MARLLGKTLRMKGHQRIFQVVNPMKNVDRRRQSSGTLNVDSEPSRPLMATS